MNVRICHYLIALLAAVICTSAFGQGGGGRGGMDGGGAGGGGSGLQPSSAGGGGSGRGGTPTPALDIETARQALLKYVQSSNDQNVRDRLLELHQLPEQPVAGKVYWFKPYCYIILENHTWSIQVVYAGGDGRRYFGEFRYQNGTWNAVTTNNRN